MGRPRNEFFIIPGCTLGAQLASGCYGKSCENCGWNQDEQERRRKLIREKGLTEDPMTGLKRLVVTERRAGR